MQCAPRLPGNQVMHVDPIQQVIFNSFNSIYFITFLLFIFISDIEMRMGFLGRLSDLPLNGHMMQPQGLADMVRSNNQIGTYIIENNMLNTIFIKQFDLRQNMFSYF